MSKNVKFEDYGKVNYQESKKFTLHQENRVIDENHVNKLKRDMETSIDTFRPIEVNIQTNNVIDGQHRLKAFQELVESGKLGEDAKIRVMYLNIPSDAEKDLIIKINTKVRPWNVNDYVKSFADGGNESYKKLIEFCDNHFLTRSGSGSPKYTYGSAIIKGKNSAQMLKEGKFTCTDYDLTVADRIHSEIKYICDTLNIQPKGSIIPSIATAWRKRRDKHLFSDYIRTLQSKKNTQLSKIQKVTVRDWNNVFDIVENNIRAFETAKDA